MIEALPILAQVAAAVQPGKGSLHHPALGQHDKALDLIRALDDLDVHLCEHGPHRRLEPGSLAATVAVELWRKGYKPNRVPSNQLPPSRSWTSAAVTTACSTRPWVSISTWRFLPLVFLAASYPCGSMWAPPFSALLTLCASMIAAVGLASRAACSRHLT